MEPYGRTRRIFTNTMIRSEENNPDFSVIGIDQVFSILLTTHQLLTMVIFSSFDRLGEYFIVLFSILRTEDEPWTKT